MKKFTLEQAVHEYGNFEQIKGFEKVKSESKKGKGNLKANNFIALERTIQQHFEDVKVEGKGSNRIFICDGELEELKKREDFRINSGNRNQLPYKEDIREAIITHLNNTNELTTTYRQLLKKLGVISDIMYVASRKFSVNEQKAFYENLDDKYKEFGHAIFWDVVQREYSRLESNIKSVLTDMAKKKIIKMSNVTNVRYHGQSEHETLHVSDAKEIDDKKTELREKYDITMRDVMFNTSDKRKQIEDYKKELKAYFEKDNIDFVYDAVAIYITATKKEIERYKARELTKTIKQKHLQHAYEKALARQEKENQLLELLGGKAKQESENEELEEIKQEEKKQEILTNKQQIKNKKLAKCYADEYKSTLINLNFNDRQYN